MAGETEGGQAAASQPSGDPKGEDAGCPQGQAPPKAGSGVRSVPDTQPQEGSSALRWQAAGTDRSPGTWGPAGGPCPRGSATEPGCYSQGP